MKKQIINITISSLLAFIILNAFCFFYYNVPTHSKSIDGASDYVWEKNKYYCSATEGISWGKTNNEGYFNINDYEGDVDILVMGSSHLQGLSVKQEDNVSTILANLTNKNIYNIAIAGHNFKVCTANLDNALNKYKPDIVVIETNRLVFSLEEIEKTISGQLSEISSSDNKIVNFLQKSDFLRLTYSQLENFINNSKNSSSSNKNSFDAENTDKLLKYISDTTNKYNTKVIILYHPTVSLNEDGTLSVNSDIDVSNSFKNLCEKNSLSFVDMSNRYQEEYKKNYTLPSGFINTAVASGHINKYGYRMIAEELYEVIKEME